MTLSNHQNGEEGFTILEMVLVIMIASIMFAFLGSSLLTYVKNNKIKATEYHLEEVEKALARYLELNGHYPCPASRFLGYDDTNFGLSVAANCTSPSAPDGGTISTGGVRIGAIPTRELNLPDKFMADGWKKKFTYAVTEIMATNLGYSANGGLITLLDQNNNDIVLPSGTAHYVIISHGETGDGAFQLLRSNTDLRGTPCLVGSLEDENCDDDSTFRNTLVTSEADFADFFDDYVHFRARTANALQSIPTGAVIPFNIACPTGWRSYTNSWGRFLSGHLPPPNIFRVETLQAIPPDSGNTINVNFALNENSPDGVPRAVIPPYTTLNFCEKL